MSAVRQASNAPAVYDRLGLGIRSREDLSFTRREGCSDNSAGLLNNWHAPHCNDDYWHQGQAEGERRFREVMQLALYDETEAARAIRFALAAKTWNGGWGEEDGFASALARVAIAGIRALSAGAEPFTETNEPLDDDETAFIESLAT